MTRLPVNRSNIRLSRCLKVGGMVEALARTNQLDFRSGRGNRNIVKADDDLGDELASTDFARATSSILE